MMAVDIPFVPAAGDAAMHVPGPQCTFNSFGNDASPAAHVQRLAVFVFDDRENVSPLSFGGDHIIGVFTCSKSFAATGFRIGFTVCRDPELIHRLTLGEYTQTAGVVPFIQKAFAEALCATPGIPLSA